MNNHQELAAEDTVDRFHDALDDMGPFEADLHLAVAVSGGPDSMAVMVMACDWARQNDARLTVLTVDHRLRPEARAEAEAVREVARDLALDHVILTVVEALPAADLEAAARAVRYDLLTSWCRAAGVLHLLTGHSQDDQAETLLLRLLRGSGLDGLSAMEPVHLVNGVRLLRPALGLARYELERVVRVVGLSPYADPMNDDPRFRRVEVRKAMSRLDLRPSLLARTAAHLRRDRRVLEDAAVALMAGALRLSARGEGLVQRPALAGQPLPVVERALARLIVAVGGDEFPPRRDRLARVAGSLAAPDTAFPGATLGNCRLLAGKAAVTVLREARGLGPDLHLGPGERGCWDGRFEVQAGPRPVTIAALGEHRADGLPPLSPPRRAVMPAVFAGNDLVAVPLLDFGDPAAAIMRYRARRAISA